MWVTVDIIHHHNPGSAPVGVWCGFWLSSSWLQWLGDYSGIMFWQQCVCLVGISQRLRQCCCTVTTAWKLSSLQCCLSVCWCVCVCGMLLTQHKRQLRLRLPSILGTVVYYHRHHRFIAVEKNTLIRYRIQVASSTLMIIILTLVNTDSCCCSLLLILIHKNGSL